MAADERSIHKLFMNGDIRSVQSKGEVVLPKEWREEHDVVKGDRVVFFEEDDGRLVVIPPN